MHHSCPIWIGLDCPIRSEKGVRRKAHFEVQRVWHSSVCSGIEALQKPPKKRPSNSDYNESKASTALLGARSSHPPPRARPHRTWLRLPDAYCHIRAPTRAPGLFLFAADFLPDNQRNESPGRDGDHGGFSQQRRVSYGRQRYRQGSGRSRRRERGRLHRCHLHRRRRRRW